MLRLPERVWMEMVAWAYDGLPDEACGLFAGTPAGRAGDARIELFVPCPNADASSRTYSIGKEGWEAADAHLEGTGHQLLGVMHSHTHTDAYPSPTDVEKAANPLLAGWHYVIVSLRDEAPVLRSFQIPDGNIVEEQVVLERR